MRECVGGLGREGRGALYRPIFQCSVWGYTMFRTELFPELMRGEGSALVLLQAAIVFPYLGTDCCVDWENDVTLMDEDIRGSGCYPGRQEDIVKRTYQYMTIKSAGSLETPIASAVMSMTSAHFIPNPVSRRHEAQLN